MKKTVAPVLVVALALSTLAACAFGGGAEGLVSTGGSTSVKSVISILGEAFEETHPGTAFTYDPTGSGSGIQAVREGRCDIGLSSRELKDEEKEQGLVGTVLAYDGVAVVVHPDNPVSDLKVEDIARLYTGEVDNWSQVGGRDAPVVLIGREAGSGTREGFESVTGTAGLCRYRQELTSTGDVLTAVSQNPDAIGYGSLASVGETVKVLTVGGVAPGGETVKDGSYAIRRPFLLVTREGEPLSETAQAFFDFALSPDRADLIARAGAVAAN